MRKEGGWQETYTTCIFRLQDWDFGPLVDAVPVKEEPPCTVGYLAEVQHQPPQKVPSVTPEPEQVATEAVRVAKRLKLKKDTSSAPTKLVAQASSPPSDSSVSPASDADNDSGIRPGSFFDILTAEERHLMEAEGIEVPPPGPLCKPKERELKRLRRQVKNKYSAKDSRRKRKEYVETLEAKNSDIDAQLRELRGENKSLHKQLSAMRVAFQRSGAKSAKCAQAMGSCGSSATSAALLLMCLLVSSTTTKPHAAKVNAGLRDFLQARLPTSTTGTESFTGGLVKNVDGGANITDDDEDSDAAAVLDSAMLSEEQSKQVLAAASKAVQDVLRKSSSPLVGGATAAKGRSGAGGKAGGSSNALKRKADVLGTAGVHGAEVASH